LALSRKPGPSMNVDSFLVSLFADISEAGALTVVRTFNHLTATSLPARMPHLSISAVVHAHPSESGTAHHFEIVLLNARREKLATLQQGEFVLNPVGALAPPGVPLRHMIVVNLLQPEFPEIGPYAFELYIDGTYHAGAVFQVDVDAPSSDEQEAKE
jgi:hypothetical protein